MSSSMSGARLFVAALGIVIAVAGAVMAAYVEKFLGIGMVLVGGFLLTLTVTKFSDTV
jgi:hypothetical protein